MSIRLRCRTTTGFLALTIASSFGMAQSETGIAVPPVPAAIEIPKGNTVFLKGKATGTQNYICLPSATGFAWTFFAPEATLFHTFRWFQSDIQQQITTHFLSPNPMENGTPRVTWQGSYDSSAVWGRAAASSTDPNFVEAGAIPWLRVEAVGTRLGPRGGGILAQTTFIHRLNTAGGVAPSTGCAQASDVGKSALVPYTADYFFYRASRD